MTDRSALIEKAARAMGLARIAEDSFKGDADKNFELMWRDALRWRARLLKQAEAVLSATVPGLLDGTAWVAPWELTDEQADVALSVTASHLNIEGSGLTVNREKMKRRFARLRDRCLNQPPPSLSSSRVSR